jgi:hypothetical protein
MGGMVDSKEGTDHGVINMNDSDMSPIRAAVYSMCLKRAAGITKCLHSHDCQDPTA